MSEQQYPVITYHLARTIRTAEYESARVEFGIEMPITDDIEGAIKRVEKLVDEFIARKEEEWRHNAAQRLDEETPPATNPVKNPPPKPADPFQELVDRLKRAIDGTQPDNQPVSPRWAGFITMLCSKDDDTGEWVMTRDQKETVVSLFGACKSKSQAKAFTNTLQAWLREQGHTWFDKEKK